MFYLPTIRLHVQYYYIIYIGINNTLYDYAHIRTYGRYYI